jgi:hypothetical protein
MVCQGECQAASCSDVTRNGDESDVDCGGSCAPCALGKACATADDCATFTCDQTCQPPQRAAVGFDDTSASTIKPKPKIRITNLSSKAVPLSELSVRYYFTREAANNESFEVYWATGDDTKLVKSGTFGDVSPSKPTANRYLEISFGGNGSIAPGGLFQTHVAFFISSFPKFDQTNDYSFSPQSALVETNKVTIHRAGKLVWGTPP